MGRDRHLRPIIVLQAAKLMSARPQPGAADVTALCVVYFEFVIKYLLKPGVVENFLMVIDCSNLSVWNMPYNMIKAVTSTIQTCYKAMSRGTFIINAPKTFSVVWQVVKYFLDAVVVQKVQITSENTCEALQNYVHPGQLETRFGGNAPNKVSDYWPPTYPS